MIPDLHFCLSIFVAVWTITLSVILVSLYFFQGTQFPLLNAQIGWSFIVIEYYSFDVIY